ncbi:hypothetical protein RSSM_06149 [Rhodopirellula sallentina SM41]|uniref:Uncharacterized protein n=1 Tax=Rhodopirellula sallentina SM41 TaxID=1263870 RepID=M5TTB5_9BACT|nr:hypothetical protein RSSM_06149 [Rhodopirellula sallentina SM41]
MLFSQEIGKRVPTETTIGLRTPTRVPFLSFSAQPSSHRKRIQQAW